MIRIVDIAGNPVPGAQLVDATIVVELPEPVPAPPPAPQPQKFFFSTAFDEPEPMSSFRAKQEEAGGKVSFVASPLGAGRAMRCQLPRWGGGDAPYPKALVELRFPRMRAGQTLCAKLRMLLASADQLSGNKFWTFMDAEDNELSNSAGVRAAVSSGFFVIERKKIDKGLATLAQTAASMPVGSPVEVTMRLELGEGDDGLSELTVDGGRMLTALGTNMPANGINRLQLGASVSALGRALDLYVLSAVVWEE